ncbi:AP-4 complex subunit epsilon-1, partial [Colius striatus]
EEEKLIQQELTSLKATVSAPNTTLRLMKECMVRLIYCEMLGYESSFGYIHAIKLAQQGNLLEKRVGYLAVSLFLHENHELLLLLVNTVVKDLQSTNLVEVCMALTIVSQIFPREMIPAVLPLIEDKLQHSKEIIRRKAVQALYKFYLIAPNQVQHIHDKFRKALCDRDAGVMAASLHIYLQMIKENSSGYKDLTGSFVTILKQVVGGKLPIDFNYHSVPAPWLQIQLLRILGLLGKDDPRTSELMYDVLDESLRRAEINHNITYAILFECVQTIYTIYPKYELLEKAAKCIGKFVLSPKINLKYLGLKALTYVIQQDPNLALQHQMTIIECLDHPDPIIKRETLELLYRITNGQNVIVIVQKILDYLKESKEEYAIMNFVGKVAELAEKYPFIFPKLEWFIQTMNAVFSVGGDVVHPDIPNNFLRLLAEGFDDGKEDGQLRMYAVQSYLALLEEEDALYPQKFLQVMSWVLGEYSSLVTDVDPEVILTKLHSLLKKTFVTSETKAWIMAAITKIASHTSCSKTVDKLIQEFSNSLDTCMRQYAFELKHLCEDKALMKNLLPFDACCNDMVVDASLSFLDGFVAEGLGRGAAPYKPHHQRQEEKLSQEKALNFEPYGLSLASSMSSSGITGRQSPTGLSFGSDTSGNSAETGHKETNTLKLEGVRKLWGKEGYLPKKENKVGFETQTVSCGSLLAGQVGDPPALQSDQVASLSEEDKEKQQLASTLFIGLGSSAGVSLMGKADTATQKFKRKSKINETQNIEEASGFQNSAASDFGPLLDTVPADIGDCEGNICTRLRKASLGSSDTVEDNLAFETPQSLKESDLDDRLSDSRLSQSSLFADSNIEIFQPSPSSQWESASKTPLIPSLPEELEELTHSEVAELCQSDALALYLCKVWTDDSLLLNVFVSNKTTSAFNAVNLVFEEAEQFQILESPTYHFPVIEAQSVERCQKCVWMNKICTQGVLSGSVDYQSEMETHLEFSITLSLLDFIRPMAITTEDFGKLWLSLSNDVKQNIKMPSSQDSLPAALNTLQQKLKLHIVDIIGNEGILACQLLPSVPCLLHCRTHSGMLAVWFRSPCSALPDGLLYQCQKVMEES